MSVEDDNKAIVRQYNALFIRNDLSTEQVTSSGIRIRLSSAWNA
jgi:hypothetical protein